MIDWSVNRLGRRKDSARNLSLVDLLAISNGEVILLVTLVAFPVVVFSFLGAGAVFKQIGKGPLSLEQDFPQKVAGVATQPISEEQREAEIRQFLEGKAYRQRKRGEKPIEIEVELQRLLASEQASAGAALGSDAQLVVEIRDLVKASNERRVRMGREPLDVDAEVQRQLGELESLGQ